MVVINIQMPKDCTACPCGSPMVIDEDAGSYGSRCFVKDIAFWRQQLGTRPLQCPLREVQS